MLVFVSGKGKDEVIGAVEEKGWVLVFVSGKGKDEVVGVVEVEKGCG